MPIRMGGFCGVKRQAAFLLAKGLWGRIIGLYIDHCQLFTAQSQAGVSAICYTGTGLVLGVVGYL